MTDIMPYQYPPPPQNGAEMDMPPSGYYPNYPVQHHPSSGMDTRSGPDSGIITSRERSDSFSKSMKLKRSISTPVVGPPSQAPPPQPPTPQQSASQSQDPLGLAGEKRRNKLGYHRTSVACGHCRRRKIRCIPSQNDVQGRCVNCIRLKKECSFYPVDQQPPPQDTRQKSASRSSVGPKVPSATSSPAMQTGIPSDIHGQQHYPQLTMPSIQNMPPPMKPPGTESYTPDSKSKSSSSRPGLTIPPTYIREQAAETVKVPSSASSSRTYDYGNHGMTNWMSADASPSSSKPSDLNTSWRSYPAESPITPAFSPYTPHAPPPSATWSASVGSEASARDDIGWSSYPAPPARSLSFGSESVSSQQHYPSMQVSSGRYPPPIATTIPGIDTVPGTTLEHSVSLSAGAVPSTSYGSWQHSYSYSKPTEGYSGGWYSEPGTHHADQHSAGHGYYER